MTNEYEVASVIELGNAQEVVLGQKRAELAKDVLTQDFGTLYIEETADND